MKRILTPCCSLVLLAFASIGHGQIPKFSPIAVDFLGAPNGAAVGDFNGDGYLDATTALGDDSVGVTLGNGDGTFQPGQYFEAPGIGVGGTAGPVSGDLNEDGLTDLVVVQYGSRDAISVLLNTSNEGSLSFDASRSIIMGSETAFAALGDLDQDGHLDVMTANVAANALSSLSYRLGDGDGTFGLAVLPPFYVAAGERPTSLALGDLNGDGKLDVVVTYGSTMGLSQNKVGVLFNEGSNGLLHPVVFSLVRFYDIGSASTSVTLGDFDGDDVLDFAVTLNEKNGVVVMLNDGIGNFSTKGRASYPVGQAPQAVTTADFNNDGKLDLAVANEGSTSISILLGNGNGTFRDGHTRRATVGLGAIPVSTMAVGDVNADGLSDLVVAVRYADAIQGAVTVLLNTDGMSGNR